MNDVGVNPPLIRQEAIQCGGLMNQIACLSVISTEEEEESCSWTVFAFNLNRR